MTSTPDAGRDFGDLHRIVVKVGSGIIAPAGRLDPLVIERIAVDVTALRDTGREVVLVVSGAVAAGYLGMGRDQPPKSVVERQAAAAVGQYQLMTMFASEFEKCDTVVAQLLMMQDDIEDRRRFLSARHTLQELLSRGILPIINENDPLADDEAKIGDNDHLAALVTSLTTADLLVILSTVAGVLRFGDEDEDGDEDGDEDEDEETADGDPALMVVSEDVTRERKFERALRAVVEGTSAVSRSASWMSSTNSWKWVTGTSSDCSAG